jgi:Leucine-rich repeat (LRR) protein
LFIKDHGNGNFVNPDHNTKENAKILLINGTKAEDITGGFSKKFPNVQGIYATNTKFRKIPSEFSHGTFHRLTNLELSNNILESLASQCFAALSKLTHLYLNNNKLSALEEGCFYGLPLLIYLNLSFNNLKTISSNIFKNLAELEFLVLTNNQLTSINAFAVENNKKLFYLGLQNNHIKAISGSAQILSVKTINLSNNRLIDVTGLKGFLNIEVLHLSSNSELKLPENSFNGLTQIWNLLLDDVNLSTVQNLHNLFSPLTSLSRLNITKNNLKTMSFEKFQTNINLRYLYLESNKLTEINIEEMKKVFPNLNQVSIDRNDWNCSYLNVTIKTLQQHKITVNAGASDEPNIKGISCNDVNLSSVQNLHNLFSPLTSLTQLNITKNNLKTISFEKFQTNTNLTNLFFDSNNLTEINIEEMKKVFPNLNRISIDKNDWNCSYLNKMIEMLQQHKIDVMAGKSGEPYINGISCISKNIWTTTSFTMHVPYILISILALLDVAVSIFFLTKNY